MMHLKLKFLFIAFVLSTLANAINAATVRVEKDNIRYYVDDVAMTAEVSGPVSSSITITNLVIPDYIEYNGSQIPVISISNQAFLYNNNLNLTGSLTIGNNVHSIGDSAFSGCSGFTGPLTIGNNVQIIGYRAFSSCSGFTGSLTIPDNVQTIGEWAFSNCRGFTGSLTIGNNVQSIGNSAFRDCRGFTGSLTIPDNVEIIGNYAFQYCMGFTGSLTIGNTVQTIGIDAFKECRGFTGSLTIGNSVQTIGTEAFYNCSGFTGSLTIPDNVQTIGSGAFNSCSGFNGSLKIPKSITTIGMRTFRGCSGFTGPLVIPDKVEAIGDYAFSGCSGFTGSLTIPNSVQTIGYEAFRECRGFTGLLTIGANVETIGESAFYYCRGFTGSLIIPNSVQTIGAGCFRSCNFGEVKSYATTPARAGKNAFDSFYSSPLYVPSASVNLYKTADEWKNFQYINPLPVEATDITLNKAELILLVGQEETLIATLTPEDATTEIVWSVDENGKNIISVDQNGKVTALKVGEAIVKATAGSFSVTCKVTVNPVVAFGVTLNVQDMTLLVGQTDKLTATIEPENATDQTIVWKSDNEAIATVGTDGTVTAVSIGTANITATCGEATATCKVTVNAVPASSIELSLEDVTILLGENVTLTAKVYPENTTNQTITWTSDNDAVASVDADGKVTALSVGTANITASCGTVSATCKVTVTPVAPTSIELNIKDMVLFIGQSETIQAIVRPANTTYPTVTWQSDDETIATVSAEGKVTGIKEGVATITASCGGVSATCTVTINPIPASNIVITSGDVTLTIGSTATLTAKVSPDNTTYPEVEWLTSDPNIATISADGIVTAVNIGTAIITAKCGTVSATCRVTVIPVPSEGIVISPTAVLMLLGENITLSATVYPESTTDKTVAWGSDNPAVASVSSDGLVTALSVGTATITASNGSAKASCTVTVSPIEATSISLNVKDETIFVESTTQLVATIYPENVTDKTITWTSSKPEIATVTEQGLVYGLSVGTTTVTATIGKLSTACQINVVHRIPDMDPSVTTSNRDIKTISGTPVNMAVYAQGGEPAGWSYEWTKNGTTVSETSELNITAINDTETVIAETYRVKVENEIDKVVILSEVFDFVVQIYPAVELTNDDFEITISTGTGSSNKAREGNTITLSAATPSGGNPQGWEYEWTSAQGPIGEGETIETIATMSAGESMEVESTNYEVTVTNYGPEGDTWAQFNTGATIEVYRRPATPLLLLKKGDGASHTFIAMMPISDAQMELLNYYLVYGWTDTDGNENIIEQTNLRYCHTEADVYDNTSNRFWVYSVWYYNDGSVVTSGRRYLDGSVDEDFDASTFDGNGVGQGQERKSRSAVFTIDGHYVGSDLSKLQPGIYIRTSEVAGEVKTQKIYVR